MRLQTLAAFLIAPLWVPVLMVLFMPYKVCDGSPQMFCTESYDVVILSLIVAYSGMILFGLPSILLLRSFRKTNFFIAPFVGFVVAAFFWVLLQVAIGVAMGAAPTVAITSLADNFTSSSALLVFLWPCLSGVLVGSTYWIIARPDRDNGAALPLPR